MIRRDNEERPQLLGVPGVKGRAGERPSLRCVRDRRRVRGDHPPPHGIVERASKHHVDLENRLRIEAALSHVVAVGEQAGVEPLDVVGSQVPERDASDAGDDVQLDVAPVAIPGARPKRGPLARQPTLREVHADGQAAPPR